MNTATTTKPVMIVNQVALIEGEQKGSWKPNATLTETYTWPDGMTIDQAAHLRHQIGYTSKIELAARK